jgi:hypothetical protein
VVNGEINRAFDDTFIVHFHKIAFANLQVSGNKTFAIRAAYFQYVAASDLFTVWIFVYFYIHRFPFSACAVSAAELSA